MAGLGAGFVAGGIAQGLQSGLSLGIQKKELDLRKGQLDLANKQQTFKQVSEDINNLIEQAGQAAANGKMTPKLEASFRELAVVAQKNAAAIGYNTDVVGAVERAMAITPTPAEQNQQDIQNKQEQINAGVMADPNAEKPRDNFINVPDVGLVDLRGDKPKVVLKPEDTVNPSSRYKNVAGVGLVDLEAEGGPKVIIEASNDPTVQKVVAPILDKLAKGEPITDSEQKVIDIYQKATTQDLLLRQALEGAGKEDIPAPKTTEEYDALPKGTKYQHPDDPPGTFRTKK